MKQLKAILIGAGLRGAHVYSEYAMKYPNELKIIAVAEPNAEKRKNFAQKHGIKENMQFTDWKEVLQHSPEADFVMVCTQDRMHYEPVIKALQNGYHVLCEKPMSPDKQEIIHMEKMAEQYNRKLVICHVLRYSPFFSKIKELLSQGVIGELVSVQHIESVGYWHHAHSFVRGNWRNSVETSPMILQKCCHDMDILLWLTGSSCRDIQSFGSLKLFRKENAPEGAPNYCMDGCGERSICPFYAPGFYMEHPRSISDGFINAVSEDTEPQKVLEALKKGPYGRCVYHCDNDVVDHQTVNMVFENDVTVSFSMCAFTDKCERVINLMGTKGQIKGNMEEGIIQVLHFTDKTEEIIRLNTSAKGHSGSDMKMMQEVIKVFSGEGETKTAAEISAESHLMALAAEESRVSGRIVSMKEFKGESMA